MLTRSYILKVSRLLDQSASPRPGYLFDQKPDFTGPGESPEPNRRYPHAAISGNDLKGEEDIPNLFLKYIEDPVTHEPLLVQERSSNE